MVYPFASGVVSRGTAPLTYHLNIRLSLFRKEGKMGWKNDKVDSEYKLFMLLY